MMKTQPDEERRREDDLIARWIEPDPLKASKAEARLVGYGIHLWALVGYWNSFGDIAEVAAAYHIPVKAVEAAMAYYRRHEGLIDDRIESNNATISALGG